MKFTDTEKDALIKTVNALRGEGQTLKKACSSAGITVSNFNYWTSNKKTNGKAMKSGNGKNRKTTKFTAVELTDSDISKLETMIMEREALTTQLTTLNNTIKTTFEKVRELEKTIQF